MNRLGLGLPDWFQHLEHQPNINRLHRQLAEDRIGISLKRSAPLRLVLLIAPACLMHRDIGLGAVLKRHARGLSQRRAIRLNSAGFNGVLPLSQQFAAICRLDTRTGQVNCRVAAETHIARPAIEHKPEYP